MDLTDDQMEQANAWIEKRILDRCPSCGEVGRSGAARQLYEIPAVGGGRSAPAVLYGCKDCGHLRLFGAHAIGLVPR